MTRNEKERDRLRAKRADPAYLARERARNRARMAKIRKRRHAKGLCWDCGKKPVVKGRIYCRLHLIKRRHDRRKLAQPAAEAHA